MFSFIGQLFGSPKAVEGIVNGVTKGLDALVYTDEEKANDAAKDRSEARQMVVQWMAATQGQNLARRLIALSITATWLGMYILGTLCNMVAIWTNAVIAEKLTATSIIATDSAQDMNGAVMLILAFYFAAPHMGDLAKAAMSKFKGSSAVPADRVG